MDAKEFFSLIALRTTKKRLLILRTLENFGMQPYR